MRGPFWAAEKIPPHQFGRMTYGRALKGPRRGHVADAAVSHVLTSSPRGERGRPRLIVSTLANEQLVDRFLADGAGAPVLGGRGIGGCSGGPAAVPPQPRRSAASPVAGRAAARPL